MPKKNIFPEVDVVIIGVNAAKTLAACLQSVYDCRYPRNRLNVIFVDGGSKDKSIKIAHRYARVKVLALKHRHPTPGRGRNAGWRAGKAPFVMFLDADTTLEADFLGRAICAMKSGIGAVHGYRRETATKRSLFNWIGDQEWPRGKGYVSSFGGDVLIRREALVRTRGYRESLVAGEDPELSRRMIRAGYRILQIPCPMTRHNLAMNRLSKYWKRAYRSGYAFAAVRACLPETDEFWALESRRILLRGGMAMSLFLTGLIACLTGFPQQGLLTMALALFLLFRPLLLRRGHFRKALGLKGQAIWIYALHCSLVVIPQCFGLFRYHLGQLLNRPLRNRASNLATGA